MSHAALPPSQYYDIPVISLRAAAWRLMSAGIEGYKVTRTSPVAVFVAARHNNTCV